MKNFFMFLTGLTLIYLMTVVFADTVTEDISKNIIRLHIIANSNSDTDQNIKLKIRDEILKSNPNIKTEEDAQRSLYKIEQAANDMLAENGFSYGATAMYGIFNFPEKSYDNFILPSGKYKSIRVILGDGKGENWWCVISPPVCITDSCVKFDSNTLQKCVNKETFTVISDKYKYKLKTVEIAKKITDTIKSALNV